ncbi:tetratricopeptide repeat protein [Streptomyces sp. ISL-1]|uniref:tetratricopeptide repeat protein n=1 Tax=Streptomyces sp. ISL-1 TaxID=2817657 RepID=UPI001BE63145|nr:tetratricopeptide repeat protein [Streptomyces sp. ISL-1]MBT2389777.1 tetratricopeptide repeat protein [Streptomyces sp. ISL-1]
MADEVRIGLLGGLRVTVADRHVAAGAWRLRKARSVLKLLALTPGHRLHRDRLYDLLWPDLDAEAASNNLHQVLHAVRRALATAGTPGDVVVLRDDMVVLGPEGGVRVDLDELEEATRRASAGGSPADYRAALALAEHELLPEDTFESWTREARGAIHVRRTGLRLGLAEALEQEGHAAEAVEVLQALIADDELNEPGNRALMRVLASAGRRRESLAVYEQLRDALRSDTGSDPDPQTREVYRTLLAGSVEEPAERGPVHRHNLPAQMTSFIGREREIAEVEELLARSKLLTLTGPGGCGKTRLALAVAARHVEAVRDGVWFIDLAALTDPRFVPDAVAAALDIQLSPDNRTQAALVTQLAGRELLLVLDNCEHLVEACAGLVADVLAHCPGVVVLATSREPLQAYGERTSRVPSLGLPDIHRLPPPAELGRFSSVRLFVERATEAVPPFQLDADNAAAVAQICFRLDGMPLALELAAARVRMLAPRQIAERLDDALTLLGQGSRHTVTRQQTLLATLQWSHQLLDPEERLLFRRLAVFAGGFSLAAVEDVCTRDIDPASVLDLLGRLVDKSLVLVDRHGDEARYRLLETIRQYARERLRESGELAQTESRHRGFYLALAESHDPELTTRASGETSLQLEADHDNLRAALRSALENDPESALRLAVALRRFWVERGYLAEGRRRLDDALSAAPAPTPLRARALLGQGVLAIRLGDSSRLASIGAEIVAIHRARGDRAALAYAFYQQAILLWMRGTWEEARTALDEACALAGGELPVLAAAAHQRGISAVCRGDGRAAREAFGTSLRLLTDLADLTGPGGRDRPYFPVMTPGYMAEEDAEGRMSLFFEESVLVGRLVGTAQARGYALSNLAWATRLDGDVEEARTAAEQSVDCFRGLGDPHGESLALNTLGNICRTHGEYDNARPHLDASLWIRRRLGDRREVGITLGSLGLLAMAVGDVDGARAAIGRSLAGFEETGDTPGRTNSLLHLGLVARAAGDTATARALLIRALDLQYVAGSTCATGWVAVMLSGLAEEAGDHAGAEAATARALGHFTQLGDMRGLAHLRRAGARAQSRR